jgi:hypothetical protein
VMVGEAFRLSFNCRKTFLEFANSTFLKPVDALSPETRADRC